MFPLWPEGEDGPEPDIIGTAGEGRGRPRWWWYVVAAGVLALAGVITVASMSSSQRHAAAPHPSGVAGSPAQPEPPAPGAVPTQAWAASLNIANWPMPGSGGMIAGGVAGSGVAGNSGWELTVRDVARPGQRCTAAVLLNLYGTITDAYPISPHPALRTPAGDLAFVALGGHSPGVGVALLQLDAPGAASADPGRIGGFGIDVPVLPVTACGQRYYLGGFAYPLAGTLDLSVAGNSASPVHYLVPVRLTRPKEPGVWHGTG
ncbi:MAG TPA: hypothetical protein VHZ03_18120 [Trebonia sp.]|jgi:hypothetical protein|nr:hypothetical protein [Trebonia sp.]